MRCVQLIGFVVLLLPLERLGESSSRMGKRSSKCLWYTKHMSTHYPSSLSDAEWAYLQQQFPLQSKRGRPPIHSLRAIFDAIFYVLRTGCPWRYLPANFPPWQTVFYHFRRLRLKGIWTRLFRMLHRAERERQGRNLHPSAAIMDAASV